MFYTMLLFKLFANDNDGDYNVITYTIISGNHDNNFTINSTTGVITTVKPLDRETQAQFVLTVRASDGMYHVRFYEL
jgi:Mg2+/citrate symporter